MYSQISLSPKEADGTLSYCYGLTCVASKERDRLKSSLPCYGPSLCAPKIHEILTPRVVALGGGSLGKRLGHGVGASQLG